MGQHISNVIQVHSRMAHIGFASGRIYFPIFGFRLSFITKSTLIPSESLNSFSNATKRNKVGTSSKVTNKSKSLSAFSSPRTKEPNTSNVSTRYCVFNAGSICLSLTNNSSRFLEFALIMLIIQQAALGTLLKVTPRSLYFNPAPRGSSGRSRPAHYALVYGNRPGPQSVPTSWTSSATARDNSSKRAPWTPFCSNAASMDWYSQSWPAFPALNFFQRSSPSRR
jgi:hypothetical protein